MRSLCHWCDWWTHISSNSNSVKLQTNSHLDWALSLSSVETVDNRWDKTNRGTEKRIERIQWKASFNQSSDELLDFLSFCRKTFAVEKVWEKNVRFVWALVQCVYKFMANLIDWSVSSGIEMLFSLGLNILSDAKQKIKGLSLKWVMSKKEHLFLIHVYKDINLSLKRYFDFYNTCYSRMSSK